VEEKMKTKFKIMSTIINGIEKFYIVKSVFFVELIMEKDMSESGFPFSIEYCILTWPNTFTFSSLEYAERKLEEYLNMKHKVIKEYTR
jgi:hypothetical protein